MSNRGWVIYTRVSSDEQANKGTSLETQQEICEAMAKATSRDVVEVIVDEGYSAASFDRPGMQRVLQMIQDQSIDGVIIKELTRLTRSMADIISFVDLVIAQDVSLVSAMEMIDTSTATGRMVIRTIINTAQWHRENINENIRLGMAKRKAQGAYMGGRVPVGLHVVERDRVKYFERCPRWGDTVAAIWPSYLAGDSLSAIVDQLKAAGIPRSDRLTKTSVRRMLSNKKYVGHLVDQLRFDQVAEALPARFKGEASGLAALNSNPSGRAWPLAGVGRCGSCGSRLLGVRARSGTGKYHHYYRCGGRARHNGCKAKDLPAETWEKAIGQLVADELAEDGAFWAEMRKRHQVATEKVEPLERLIAQLTLDRDKARKQQDALLDLYLEKSLGQDAVRARLDRLGDEVANFETEMAKAQGEMAAATINMVDLEAMIETERQGLAQLGKTTPELLNRALSRLVAEAVIDGPAGTVEIALWPAALDAKKNGPGVAAPGRVRNKVSNGTRSGT